MSDPALLKKLNLKNPWHLMAVGFGSGLSPKAPGTCGSFAAMFICMALLYCPVYVTLAVTVVVFILGTIACNKAEEALGMHDHGGIVIDEFVGMFISILAFPAEWYWAIVAFVLFRFFDILKPFPVNYADRKIGGGLGVMVDDVVAGLYAYLAGLLIMYFVVPLI